MKAKELLNLNDIELFERLSREEAELYNVRHGVKTGQIKKHRQIRGHKKNIARLKTVIKERQKKDDKK